MKILNRIKKAQEILEKYKADAYIVTSSDYHQSEYIDIYFKGREYLSGFTGSAGTLVIFKDEACLWTDGRYHIQAEKQLAGSGIKLFKQGNIGVPSYKEYILSKLKENSKLGIDAKIVTYSDVNEIVSQKKLKIVDFDLLAEVWEDRKSLPNGKIFILEDKYSGKSYNDKIQELRDIISSKNADYNIVTTLDDIAWIYNFRGEDIKNNPVALSFTIISKDKSVLYIDNSKLDKKCNKYFKDNKIEIKEYFMFFEDIKKLKGNILVDFNKISYGIFEAISKNKIISSMNPSTYLKSHKNEIEIKNTKEIHIQDGVAIVKFMYWLKNNYKKEKITEYSAEQKIDSLRKKIEGFIDLSFDSISAFGANAAMMHYKSNKENEVQIKDGVYLLDSGGTYLKGTTDITRTFFLGKVARQKKVDNTLVLKGMLALTRAKFLFGATGTNLDILARQFLWNVGIDYKCGTGHGVGHVLNVHEGPHGIRMQYNPQRLENGMIVTNEPGAYIQNSHGIRIENELLVRECCETEQGKFMEFETITYAPIDLDGIVKSLLTKEEKKQLNLYHKEVFEKLSPYLTKKEIEFLKEYTKEI